MNVPLLAWFAVLGVIAVLLAVDLLAHRRAHVIGLREAAAWSAGWVAVGVAFGIVLWSVYGAGAAQQYYAGYLIEKSLAVDNVFVWALAFSYLGVPRERQHRVLFLGVLGALAFRGAFIAAGAVLIDRFAVVLYVFGAFLLWTGWRMLRQRDQHYDPSRSRALRLLRRVAPGAGPLVTALVVVEVTDIVFAVDSIPAIFAVTDEPFLVFTANAFAILGLRAMYFLLADLMHRFVYLKAGLALVMAWVGAKMLAAELVHVPTAVSLAVVVALVGGSIAASLRRPVTAP